MVVLWACVKHDQTTSVYSDSVPLTKTEPHGPIRLTSGLLTQVSYHILPTPRTHRYSEAKNLWRFARNCHIFDSHSRTNLTIVAQTRPPIKKRIRTHAKDEVVKKV